MKRLTVFILIMLMMSFPGPGVAGGQKPAPPQSRAFGKPLAEWMRLYWTWCLTHAAQCPTDVEIEAAQIGRVALLPMPLLDGALDVTLEPGTPFVTPVLVFIGETHGGEPDDVPLPPEIFTGATVQVMLDGQPLIDSSVDDLKKYYFGPVYFAEPIPLDPESSALWVQGLGFAHPPLSVGQHQLTMDVNVEGVFGFFNTWQITVRP